MKIRPGLIVLPLAGVLAVTGASVVLAAAQSAPSPAIVTPAAETPAPDPSASAAPLPERTDTILGDALDGLVTDGTITADQRTKILAAVVAERTARREQRQADRQVLKDALADGEITQAELEKLSEDHWLRQATDLMADGKITLDELRGLGRGFRDGGRGHHFRGRLAPDASPTASPAPTSGTSG